MEISFLSMSKEACYKIAGRIITDLDIILVLMGMHIKEHIELVKRSMYLMKMAIC